MRSFVNMTNLRTTKKPSGFSSILKDSRLALPRPWELLLRGINKKKGENRLQRLQARVVQCVLPPEMELHLRLFIWKKCTFRLAKLIEHEITKMHLFSYSSNSPFNAKDVIYLGNSQQAQICQDQGILMVGVSMCACVFAYVCTYRSILLHLFRSQ